MIVNHHLAGSDDAEASRGAAAFWRVWHTTECGQA